MEWLSHYLFQSKNTNCQGKRICPGYNVKVYHFASKIISCAAKRLEADRPGKGQDNKPDSANHWEVVHKDKGYNTEKAVILTEEKKQVRLDQQRQWWIILFTTDVHMFTKIYMKGSFPWNWS